MFGKKILSMFILSGGLVLAGCSANESVGGEEKKETTRKKQVKPKMYQMLKYPKVKNYPTSLLLRIGKSPKYMMKKEMI